MKPWVLSHMQDGLVRENIYDALSPNGLVGETPLEIYEAVGALSPDGLVRETPLIYCCGRGCSLTRWVGGRDSTNKLMWPWVLSHQMGW